MNSRYLTEKIKAEALSLGFFACGIARAEAVDDTTATTYRHWIAEGRHASMQYLADNIDKRLDPRLLMEGVRSIVCVALSYAPSELIPDGEYLIARYAYGKDYHDVMKQKLHSLASACGITTYRAFCDTAPVLERYWAQRAGLGWTGRNRQLIIPHAGSMFFLGELFVTEQLVYDNPSPNRCGNCHACIDTCPTHALTDGSAPHTTKPASDWHDSSLFDSRKCLSYLTIEHRGDFTPSQCEAVKGANNEGNYIYGCDRCLDACPWNRFAVATAEPLFQPSPALLAMTKEAWHGLTLEQYRALFKGSAVKRAKYDGLMRNIRILTITD